MGASERRTIVLRIAGPIDRADVPGLCAQLGGLVGGDAPRVVVCDVDALVEPDVVTVETLARLQLTARRLGCELQLRRTSAELQELLGFMGLQEVLLRLEVGRQSEEWEERLGVEEERELDDPVA